MVSGMEFVLLQWYAQNRISEYGVELPRTTVRREKTSNKGKLCTISAPDFFRSAALRRDILNTVRLMMTISNINGIEKTA
jgi:hypothetical protein